MAINGRDSKFVGWGMRDAVTTTMFGLGIGTPVTELKEDSAVVVNFFEDSFGSGFYVGSGGIEGMLSSSDEDAVVTYLNAGYQCAYR